MKQKRQKEWWEKYATPEEKAVVFGVDSHVEKCLCANCNEAYTILAKALSRRFV